MYGDKPDDWKRADDVYRDESLDLLERWEAAKDVPSYNEGLVMRSVGDLLADEIRRLRALVKAS